MPLAQKSPADDPRSLQARVDAAMGAAVTRSRARRHTPGLAATLIAIWLLVAAWAALAPRSYASRFTLILPGGGSTVSISLDSIGQSTSAPAQQFSGPSLSPKVIYKEIAQSELVRTKAAQSLGMTMAEFGRPRIRLIEETALILVEMRGETPEIARRKAEALDRALQGQLDSLRRDELEKRAAAVRDHLKSYQDQVSGTRARILEAQRTSGLASVNQYNELSTSVVLARRRLTDLHAEIERLGNEQVRLVERVGVDPRSAGAALELSASPAFVRLAAELAEANAVWRAETRRLGPGNPVLVNVQKRRAAVLDQLVAVSGPQSRAGPAEVEQLALLLNGSHRAELFKAIVANEAALEGRREELRTLEAAIERMSREVRDMSVAAARLEDLRKDQLVAEAVLTSALARLDTTKADIYGSYPMMQMLAAPDLPESPTLPVALLAVVGGLAASLFVTMAWVLVWWRPDFVRGRRKSA